MSDDNWTEQPWWEGATVEVCKLQPGERPGWVYFIACQETQRCKIGYTGGDVEKRLKALQTGASGKLRLMAKHPGTPDTEKAVHARFASQRLHGEWFKVNAAMFAYMNLTVWIMGKIHAEQGIQPEPWLLAGLRMMNEEIGPLPNELASLIMESEPK